MTDSRLKAKKTPPPYRKRLTVFVQILTWPVFLVIAGWTSLAIYYSNLPDSIRAAAALIFGLGSLFVLVWFRPWRKAVAVFVVVFTVVLIWWLNIPPDNNGDWQPDVAVLPYATINSDSVTIHNIRNCDYQTETDYIVNHYDKTFSLADLQSLDLFLVYWGSPNIAHTMFSFGFGGDDFVCFSIETRKQKGQEYSAIKGFFKQYKLTYVVADERDVVRLRTNYRNEDVYLYRLKTPPERVKLIFLDYLGKVNQLKERSEWYNAITSNCTTNIRKHTAPYNPDAKFDWRILINGYLDEFIYEENVLYQGLPFPELRTRCHINARAKEENQEPNFSKRIRAGLPGF